MNVIKMLAAMKELIDKDQTQKPLSKMAHDVFVEIRKQDDHTDWKPISDFEAFPFED